jgi:hypothetical protein
MLGLVGGVYCRFMRVAEGVWNGRLCRDIELELRAQERTAEEEP